MESEWLEYGEVADLLNWFPVEYLCRSMQDGSIFPIWG